MARLDVRLNLKIKRCLAGGPSTNAAGARRSGSADVLELYLTTVHVEAAIKSQHRPDNLDI